MDVILDSNIFLGDLKFRGTQFGELFAYLRRTGSNLVLPTIVYEEVLERYRDRLRNSINQAKSSWASLLTVAMIEQHPLPHLDIEKEIQAYTDKLVSPAPGVAVRRYSSVEGIDVNEIVRRGVRRQRPANSNGEELRDVILWLLLFQYAKDTNREVALVSGDNAFRKSKEDDVLHPDLEAEIASQGLPVHFHREISSFVTSQSLSHGVVDETWVARYISRAEVEKAILNALSESYVLSFGFPRSASLDELEYVSGTEYRISKDSVYGELKYEIKALLAFDFLSIPFTNISYVSTIPDQIHLKGWNAISPFSQAKIDDNSPISVGDPLLNTAFTPAASGLMFSPTISGGLQYSPDIASGIAYSPNVAAGIVQHYPRQIEKTLRFDVALSLRVRSEKLLNWQVDEVSLVED